METFIKIPTRGYVRSGIDDREMMIADRWSRIMIHFVFSLVVIVLHRCLGIPTYFSGWHGYIILSLSVSRLSATRCLLCLGHYPRHSTAGGGRESTRVDGMRWKWVSADFQPAVRSTGRFTNF